MNRWKRTEIAKYGVVIYNFEGKVTYGLQLTVGDTVHILEECGGWYRGHLFRDKAQKGIFPAAYVCLKECDVEHPGTPYEVVIPKDDHTVKELTSVLREWSVIWKQQYVKNKMQMFVAMRKIMWDLVEFRQQLLSGTLTQDQLDEIKQKAISNIDWANSKMCLDLVPRINGEVVDADSTSVVELYQVHLDSSEACHSVSGRGTIRRAVKPKVKILLTSHHMYFNMNSFMCNVEESCEVFFSIYDSRKSKFFSERFLVSIGKRDSNQKVNQLQKISNSTCVFTDLGSNDLKDTDAYLVAHLIRVGKMLSDSSSKKVSNASYRRPFGCAVVDILDLFQGKEEMDDKELFMPIQLVSSGSESDYLSLHDNIIKKLQSRYGPPESSIGIYVTMRMLHGELDKIQQENPLLLPQGITIARKLGFPEVIMPGDVRNDVYVTIDRGEFEKGSGKTTAKNVEVSMCIVGANGRLLEDCIFLGAGNKPLSEYESHIYYHNSNPKWSETVKVQISFEKFDGSILRFGFRHLSKFEDKDKESKTFAFSFIKLMREDGTTVRDGTHELCLYKFDANAFYDSKAYVNMPSMQSEVGTLRNAATDRVNRSTKDTFIIKTVVCSTKLAQNVDLVGLLGWRQQTHNLQAVLQSLFKIDGEEIVKSYRNMSRSLGELEIAAETPILQFLQDIFDALFSILNESIEQYDNLVFQAMVFIIWILSNEKYQHFQAVLKEYIEKHFSGAIAHKKLVSCLKQALEQVGDQSSIERLKKTIMSLEYIFRFIIQSRILSTRSSGEKNEDEFRVQLQSVFLALNNLLAHQSADLVPAQGLALQNFAAIYKDALKPFSRVELSHIVKDFLNSVVNDTKSKALTCPKLQCIGATVKSDLFVNEDSRKVLMPVIVHHIYFHLSHKQEMKTCAEILGSILTSLQTKAAGNTDDDVYLVVKTLLQTVFQTVMTVDRAGVLARHVLAILVNLLRIMKEDHYHRYIQEFTGRKELKDFLFNVFVVFTEMVKRDIFPKDWVVLIMLANNVILTAIQNFSQALCTHFSGENFDLQLWNGYFQLSVAFLTQSHLQLENFTEVKRNKIIDRYGDMRQVMGFEIGDMWQHLGEHKKHFIPSLIGPFLEMTLVPEAELRRSTLPIFFDMIESELQSQGFIQKVENELVNKLDKLVSAKKRGDEEYKELFHEILSEKVESGLVEFKEEGLGFVNRITKLLELLLDFRSCVTDDNAHRRMSCIVNLLEFYRGIDREDMYIRYINRLCELHIPAEDFTEAGFALLLHAELLSWADRPINDSSTSQMERQLKEKLYLDAIGYFDKGKCWEKGIELCKELAELYENELYDFVKLSDILKSEASFYDKIMNKMRPEPEYFRVGLYGKGFPSLIRNKTYVYRGQEYEKIGDFNRRMQAQFPDAQMMDKLTPPEDSILESPSQYIQTCRLIPVSEHEDRFRGRDVDERITSYYKVNHVQRFTFNRPFHRGQKDKLNEFASLWLERTTITSTSSLPGILRWFPVTTTTTEEISPVRNAVETVERKNTEMHSVISRLTADPNQSINPLSMILNGVIDAAVMGGTTKYKEAFFVPGYLLSNPGDQGYVDRLDTAIKEQVPILEGGLALHERLATKNLIPFHEKMVRLFAKMRADVTGEKYEEPIKEPQPFPIQEPSPSKKDRKLSLPVKKSSPNLSRRNVVSDHSLWYDGHSPSAHRTLGSSSTLNSSQTSLNSMTSLSSSMTSLSALNEVDENAPPIPEKITRTPSHPEVERTLVLRRQHKNSSPAAVLPIGTEASESSSSPGLPAKKERSGSSLLTTANDETPEMPPPLPPRHSIVLASNLSTLMDNRDGGPTSPDERGPVLPPKSRDSILVEEGDAKPILSQQTPNVPSSETPPTDNYDYPITLPEKHTSIASSPSSTALSPKSFPDSPLMDFNATFPPFPSGMYDTIRLRESVSTPGSVSSRTSVDSVGSRASLASPEGTLTPLSTGFSPTPTSSRKFLFEPVTPQNSDGEVDLLNFSPEKEAPGDLFSTVGGFGFPLELSSGNSNTVKDVSSSLGDYERLATPTASFQTLGGLSSNNSTWESFNDDIPGNFFAMSSSGSHDSWSSISSSQTTSTETSTINGKMASFLMTSSTVSSFASPSSTPSRNVTSNGSRPSNVTTAGNASSGYEKSSMIAELKESMRERLMTSPAGPTRPTPAPRRIFQDNQKCISTPSLFSDEKPPIKPRASLVLPSKSPEPPPKPHRPCTQGTPPATPPKPKPFASKLAENSPKSKRDSVRLPAGAVKLPIADLENVLHKKK